MNEIYLYDVGEPLKERDCGSEGISGIKQILEEGHLNINLPGLRIFALFSDGEVFRDYAVLLRGSNHYNAS